VRRLAVTRRPAAAELDPRLELVPHMGDYARLRHVVRPYLTLAQQPAFATPVVETDEEGFRVSYRRGDRVDSTTWDRLDRRGLLVGGSFVFGVGASRDEGAPASQLADLTGVAFLNLGLRAGNSTQEVVACLPFLLDADVVVVATGVNNIVAATQTAGRNERFGPFFYEAAFGRLADWPIEELGAALRGRRLPEPPSTARNGTWPPDGATGPVSRALARQARDLRILGAVAARVGAQLVVALQPYAPWIDRVETPEERRLFQALDAGAAGAEQARRYSLQRLWLEAKAALDGAHEPARAMLAEVSAELGARFVDLNALPYDGWCFVDRVHLTDRGYAAAAARLGEEVRG
jgi:hypothetical protein